MNSDVQRKLDDFFANQNHQEYKSKEILIRLLNHGDYELTETKHLTKILRLSDKGTFAWINAGEVGEILVATEGQFKDLYILASGKYRIYEVKDEDKLTDTLHLELLTGKASWQGYLLATGLPTPNHKRTRIIPTEEIITKSKPPSL